MSIIEATRGQPQKGSDQLKKKPVHRAVQLEEAIAGLSDAEQIVAEMQSSDVLQAFTETQRTHYHAVCLLLRELLRDLSQDNSRGQLAS